MKDTMRTIKAVTAERPALLDVRWSDGTRAKIDIASMLDWLSSLRDPHEFAHVRIGVGTFYDFEAIGGRMIWVRNVWPFRGGIFGGRRQDLGNQLDRRRHAHVAAIPANRL